jgi:hypothetical protein
MAIGVALLRLANNLGGQPMINPPNGDNMTNGASLCFANGHTDIIKV